MSKKHFEALAAALREEIQGWDEKQDKGKQSIVALTFAAEAVADTCARFNPNFDRARFLAACGVEG